MSGSWCSCPAQQHTPPLPPAVSARQSAGGRPWASLRKTKHQKVSCSTRPGGLQAPIRPRGPRGPLRSLDPLGAPLTNLTKYRGRGPPGLSAWWLRAQQRSGCRARGRAKPTLLLTSFFQETCNKPALRRLKLSEDLLLYFYTCDDAPPSPRPALPLLAMADQQEAPALTQGG